MQNSIQIILYNDSQHRDKTIHLWKQVFAYDTAHNEPHLVLDRKLALQDDLLFLAVDGEAVLGTIMAGYDGHRGWLYSVAVHPSQRKKGLGAALVRLAEQALAARGCMKINLQIVSGNEAVTAFYASLGYAVEKRVSMGKTVGQNIPVAQGLALNPALG